MDENISVIIPIIRPEKATRVIRLLKDDESFRDFEHRIIRVTHTHHELADELHDRVKQKFMQHAGEDGARFEMPIRVDLLRKS